MTGAGRSYRCRVTIPELNPEMDVYRIGTLLEMVREIAYVVALDGKKVKVCVQQAMGEGVFQVNAVLYKPQLAAEQAVQM